MDSEGTESPGVLEICVAQGPADWAIAHALTAWLQANSGLLPRSLVLDGKCGMIITLCRHEDGRPVAMIPATGEKEDCEVSEARALLADPQVRLENALITADPLHNKQATVRIIAEKGGDYLIDTKDNTPKRHEAVAHVLRAPPFCRKPGSRARTHRHPHGGDHRHHPGDGRATIRPQRGGGPARLAAQKRSGK